MKTKEFPTLEKLIDTAVKSGHNRQDATGVISKSYEYIKRIYPNATAKKAVHIAFVIY
jgi:hypothetical protein